MTVYLIVILLHDVLNEMARVLSLSFASPYIILVRIVAYLKYFVPVSVSIENK